MPVGWETVLLVEDEDAVRALAREVLRRHGYVVLEARHGVDALRVAERHADDIHLLVTDVVMPHMSGRELAERLATVRPAMKMLFMSGYTDHALVHDDVTPGAAFLQKPFTPEVLRPQGAEDPRRGAGAAAEVRIGTVRAPSRIHTMPDSAATPSVSLTPPSAFRRRLPIGAEIVDAQTVHVRVWAPRATRVDVVNGRRRSGTADARGRRLLQRDDRRGGRRSLPVQARRRRARSIRIRRRAFSRTVRTVRRRSSIPPRSAGPTAAGAACRAKGRSSTSCTSARSRAPAPGRRRRASCRSWRGSASRSSR